MGKVMTEYELHCRDKLMVVVEAALMNAGASSELEITTRGYDPKCRVYVPAYVLKKLLETTE